MSMNYTFDFFHFFVLRLDRAILAESNALVLRFCHSHMHFQQVPPHSSWRSDADNSLSAIVVRSFVISSKILRTSLVLYQTLSSQIITGSGAIHLDIFGNLLLPQIRRLDYCTNRHVCVLSFLYCPFLFLLSHFLG